MKGLKLEIEEEDYSLTEQGDMKFVMSPRKSTNVGVHG